MNCTVSRKCFKFCYLLSCNPRLPSSQSSRCYASSSSGVVQRPTARKANPPKSQSPTPSKQTAPPKSSIENPKPGRASGFKINFKHEASSPKKLPLSPRSPSRTVAPVLDEKNRVAEGMRRTSAPVGREKSVDEELAALNQAMSMSQLVPTLDVWGAPIQTLDVCIPPSLSYKPNASPRDYLTDLQLTSKNHLKNILSMYSMARENAFPDMMIKRPWSLQLFKTMSTKPNSWLAPFRKIALDTYKQLGQALADCDEKALKRLAIARYQDDMLKMVRKRQKASPTVVEWKLLGETTPTQVVSLRTLEGYLGVEEPKIGNRLVVQALVKFDTQQTIQNFRRDGTLLGPTGAVALDQSAKPERQRVVEYLVFEKKMWYDSPWMIREKIYPYVEPKFSKL